MPDVLKRGFFRWIPIVTAVPTIFLALQAIFVLPKTIEAHEAAIAVLQHQRSTDHDTLLEIRQDVKWLRQEREDWRR